MANKDDNTSGDRQRWGSMGGRAWRENHTPIERTRAAQKAGRALQAKRSPEERRELAKKAAAARWGGNGPKPSESAHSPKNARERLAAGLCRRCPRPRHVDPKTGKTSALWCDEHIEAQRGYDKKSWDARH